MFMVQKKGTEAPFSLVYYCLVTFAGSDRLLILILVLG